MTPEDILKHPANVLSQAQREFYMEKGYLKVEDAIPQQMLDDLRTATDEMLEESRQIVRSNERFDLGPQHSAETPRPRRIRAAVDQHPAYWAFASSPLMVDIVADVVGPDVKFHSSKLNFKWPGGAEEVKWHQDIPAWPHTNYSPVTVGIYLEDVSAAEGPLTMIPGSHNGELFDHQDPAGKWLGYIGEDDLKRIDLSTADELDGPAGSLVLLNCRTVHGSRPAVATRPRPMLLNVYSSADAFILCAPPTPTSHTGEIVRGKPARWSHNDPRPCRIPPDWSKQGYVSIYAAQKHETVARAS
jgi:ectoine hydroxylase-related dioxygenase (phytanoyl-CoA dioxygenase family)